MLYQMHKKVYMQFADIGDVFLVIMYNIFLVNQMDREDLYSCEIFEYDLVFGDHQPRSIHYEEKNMRKHTCFSVKIHI